jgi:hypothetical protein
MKNLLIVCLCLFLGFVLGRWTPTVELRRVKQELKEARAQGGGSALGAGRTITTATDFLRIEKRAKSSPGEDGEEIAAAARVDEPETNAVETLTGDPGAEEDSEEEQENRRRSIEEQIETAKEAWQVRSELARTSFLENLSATGEQAQRFDVLVGAMNLRLQSTIENWVEKIKVQDVIRAEDGARLVHDLSGVMVLTYDEMDRSFDEGWRDNTDPEFMLFDFVDPSVADSLIDAEDLINERERNRRF